MSELHRLTVDRHEADLTVVQVDGAGFVDLPRWMLPTDAGAGDIISVTVATERDRAVVTLVRDPEATARAQQLAREAINRLKSRDPGGDVTL